MIAHVQREDQRALTRGIARVAGLQAVLDHALGSTPAPPCAEFGTGNIILGGDGSDIILGRGGDDVIDGDASLNVRISVRQNVDGTGPEIASFDSMAPMIPLMPAGTYNPGQLVAVREIMPGTANAPGRADNFDTAVFQGNLADYTHCHQQQRHAARLPPTTSSP